MTVCHEFATSRFLIRMDQKEVSMIQLNGKEVELEKPITLDKLVVQQGYVMTQIAVEKNGEIIPKSTYGEEVVRDGDVIEVVTFVGGG